MKTEIKTYPANMTDEEMQDQLSSLIKEKKLRAEEARQAKVAKLDAMAEFIVAHAETLLLFAPTHLGSRNHTKDISK